MRVLTFSTLYPNAVQPRHGIFVEQRLRQLLTATSMTVHVIAPVPWFPFHGARFGQYGVLAKVPASEQRYGIQIQHPRYPLIPKVGMAIAPWLMAVTVLPVLRRLLQTGDDFDLIDAHYLYPDGVAASLLGQWLNKPVVLTARGSDVNVLPKYFFPRRMILRACQHSKGIVTVSESLKTALVALGVEAENIYPLPNGVDLDLFRPVKPWVQAWPAESGKKLLSVGNLVEGKGHHIAIEALAQLPETALLIIGQGVYAKALRLCARRYGVFNRVQILDNVPQQELPHYYSAADAVVMPSAREGMPNVLLESLACGTPVVATRVGGIPEIVTDDNAGVLFEPRSATELGNALRRLWRINPACESVRDYAKQFGWSKTITAQFALFRRFAEEKA